MSLWLLGGEGCPGNEGPHPGLPAQPPAQGQSTISRQSLPPSLSVCAGSSYLVTPGINPLTTEGIPSINPLTTEGIPSINPLTAEGIPSINPLTAEGIPSINPLTAEGILYVFGPNSGFGRI